MKRSSLLFAIYLAIVAVFALLQEQEFRSTTVAMEQQTAELLGRDIATAISGPSLERLLLADRGTREALRDLIARVTRGSRLVESIAVVDLTGRVVASEGPIEGDLFPMAERVFDPANPEISVLSSDRLRPGRYIMQVPLQVGERLVGYLRIGLDSRSIAAMHRSALVRLALVSLGGLVALVAVASVLQSRQDRRVRRLVEALDAAGRGEVAARAEEVDEFAPVFEAAARVGLTVRDERAVAAASRRSLEVLGRPLEFGFVTLRADGELDYADGRARDLIGGEGSAEVGADAKFLAHFDQIRPQLGPVVSKLTTRESPPEAVEVEILDVERLILLRLDVYAIGETTCEGYLILVRDREALQALETDIRLAGHLRVLSRVHLATAHDIRAPLNAMVLNLELLRQTIPGPHGPDEVASQLGYVDVIGTEMRRLHRMVESLLGQARLTGDSIEPFDLAAAVQELLLLLEPYCRERRVSVEAELAASPVTVTGNRDAIKQTVLNIMINGLDAMCPVESASARPLGVRLAGASSRNGADGTSGASTVAHELRVQLRTDEGRAVLAIGDTGPGIAPEMLHQMFTMFATTKRSGIGAGLYVARSVVEAHKGKIRASSEPGAGARFTIELPLTTSAN